MSTKLKTTLGTAIERNAIRMGFMKSKKEYHVTKWDIRFMRIADLEVAQWSKDRSSKVGCVLVKDREIITTGFNGMPRGINDDIDARHEKPEKYYWFHHAELNAVVNAARQGKSTLGWDAYINWFPCDHCAGVLVNAGIKRVFCDKELEWGHEKWGDGFKRAKTILEEGNIEIIFLDYDAHRQGNI